MSWEYFNPNPVAAREEDCAVRAVSAALGISWDKAFDMIAHNAKQMGAVMPAVTVVVVVAMPSATAWAVIPAKAAIPAPMAWMRWLTLSVP